MEVRLTFPFKNYFPNTMEHIHGVGLQFPAVSLLCKSFESRTPIPFGGFIRLRNEISGREMEIDQDESPCLFTGRISCTDGGLVFLAHITNTKLYEVIDCKVNNPLISIVFAISPMYPENEIKLCGHATPLTHVG